MSEKELYPDSKAVYKWQYKDVVCYLLKHPMGHYCGYARFSERPVKHSGCDGIMDYIPVHGGITFTNNDEAGYVYGFDCAHYNDENNPLTHDLDWLKGQCHTMADAIKCIVEFEDAYLLADGDNEERLKILEAFQDKLGKNIVPTNSVGVMLNILSGKL